MRSSLVRAVGGWCRACFAGGGPAATERRASRARTGLCTIARLATMVAVTACKFGEVTVPRGESEVAVHAVLNPAYAEQVILVERTLVGTISVDTTVPFDPSDPVRTGRGVPVSGARVVLSDGTRQWTAVEDRSASNPRGAGVYRITLGAGVLRPGATYTLVVRTPDSVVVSGSTFIPEALPAPIATGAESFNRDADTIRLAWPAARGARSYATFAESPYGAFNLFGDSLSVRLPGTLRNIFANRIPHVFIPGFRQEVIVAAVDTNYYDYYRSRNDPFTGSGIANHLEGGIGVFGSLVPVVRRRFDVSATMRDPIEGTYVKTASTTSNELSTLTVYVESPSVNGAPDVLSGRWTRAGTAEQEGFLGTREGRHLHLALLNRGSANDTVAAIVADWHGDTISGGFEQGGTIVFVRQR